MVQVNHKAATAKYSRFKKRFILTQTILKNTKICHETFLNKKIMGKQQKMEVSH